MLSVSLAGTMLEGLTSSGIMQMVSQANREIENWNIEIFGDMEKDADGNLVQKQWTIPRSDSKTIHATENSEVKSAYEKLMNNEQNQKDKARYEELSKKEELDDNETKEFNELCRKLITVRDGKLGEWIGYAPQFYEGEKLDLSKNKNDNLADKGLGQMGKIMLDFQWNSMRASQGWAKLSLPMYDQPLWKNNGSFFEPPTLRSVSSVVIEIVGVATGQAWWFSYADDLLFAAMDLGAGYKSASEVGLELAKTAATAAIGAGMGAASNALGDIAGNALQGASKFTNFAAQAGISMTTNYVTSVANSAVNSFYIGEDGKLGFKTEDFTKSLYSANTISGALGAGITGGMGALNLRDGNNIKLNSNTFNVSGISAFNSLAGGLVQNGVALAMGGNANFNLLNYKGVGMLEFSFGKDGIKSKIGMGGTNISIQNLRNVAAGYKEASKVTDWKYGSTETSSTLNFINMLGYTTSGMNQQLAKDIWNEKLAVEYGDTGNDYGNYTVGENKIVLSENLLGGGREASAKLATVMSHEGSHYNGNRVEAIAHLAGADTYSQLNEMFKLQADTSFSMEMVSGIMNVDNWKENTGDVDHWKMTWGGQLINDGQGWLIDENGMYINIDGTKSEKPIVGKTLGAGKLDENGNPIVGATGNIETGLLNIIANTSNNAYSSFTDEQIKAAQDLLIGAGMTPSNPDADFKDYNWSSNGKGQKLNMYDFMETAGENVAEIIFERYYNNTVDSQISKLLNVNLGFDTGKRIPSNQYFNYSKMMIERFMEYGETGNAKQALFDKYFQTFVNNKNETTTLYRLDTENPFLDKLLGQHDFKYLNESIDQSGCNFMTQIAIPQLLTGNILNENEIDTIWKEANKDKSILTDSSSVKNPEELSSIYMSHMGLKYDIALGRSPWWDTTVGSTIAYRVEVPYSPYHYTLGDGKNIIYNPGYTTSQNRKFLEFYFYGY